MPFLERQLTNCYYGQQFTKKTLFILTPDLCLAYERIVVYCIYAPETLHAKRSIAMLCTHFGILEPERVGVVLL